MIEDRLVSPAACGVFRAKIQAILHTMVMRFAKYWFLFSVSDDWLREEEPVLATSQTAASGRANINAPVFQLDPFFLSSGHLNHPLKYPKNPKKKAQLLTGRRI